MRTDFHIHTRLGIGVDGPLAMLCRARALGLHAVHLADLVDASSLEPVLAAQRALMPDALHLDVELVPGVCLAHVPPGRVETLIARARELGARQVAVYGETLGDQVPRGTNLAAIEAGADVLLHPGLITPQEAALAATRGVRLELCAHPRHCLANGHVARLAREHGAELVTGSGARSVGELLPPAMLDLVRRGAGWQNAR
ncbi:histidinol phosphate phosphatase domain-containing protein [Megalodesulfovibrio paquesii]